MESYLTKRVGTKVIHKWTSIQKNEWHKNCKKPKYHEYAKVKKEINTYLERVQNLNKIITTHSQVETIKLDKSPQYPQAIHNKLKDKHKREHN